MNRQIRALDAAEVETLVGWARVEGWNPGIGDAAAFHAADQDGFLGAFVDGEFVAGISAVAYGETFGFIGLYICRPEFRGQGHGKAVWDAGMERLAGRTIGLDGVPEQQANYASMGFAKAYETVRMTGMPPATGEEGIAEVSLDVSGELRALDRLCFPEARDRFLAAWLAPPRQALVAVVDGHVAGYGVVRRCEEGHKVGPLFAQSEAVAGRLLSALAKRAGGPVQVDVPASQPGFGGILRDAGMTPGFSTARMYRGEPPSIATDKVFGITTLELG
jgi:hypothetical protein